MRIRDKLLVMLAIPTTVLLLAAGLFIHARLSAWQDVRHTAAALDTIAAMAAVTHALQAERGSSVGYVSSGGKNRDLMDAARSNTDKALSELPAADGLTGPARSAWDNWRRQLAGLAENRRIIDRLSYQPQSVFKLYTEMVSTGMSTTSNMARDMEEVKIKSSMDALLALQCAKENMGRQRARVMGAISSGSLSAADGQAIAQLIGQEQACGQQFQMLNSQNPEAWARWQESASVQDTARMRATVLAGNVSEVEPKAWFATSSAKINDARTLETGLIEQVIASNGEIRTSAVNQLLGTIAGLLLVLIVSGVMIWRTSRSLLGSVQAVQSAMLRIARERDLTVSVPVSGDQEMADIARAFNALADSLRATLTQVIEHSITVESSATALASASNDVASSSATQSEATASAAAAVEEMTTSLASVVDLITEVSQLASDANFQASSQKEAVLGAAQTMHSLAQDVRTTAQLMRDLESRSTAISSVLQVIREIADQTNLLALNAAIEAARAGESGRGFAVVADEVRKLAERTSKSTHEIAEVMGEMRHGTNSATQQMQQSEAQVEEGARQAQNTVSTLEGLATEIARIAEHMQDVMNASREQNSASLQLARNVEKISHMIEQNSQATSHTAEAARQLKTLAADLHNAAASFRTSAN